MCFAVCHTHTHAHKKKTELAATVDVKSVILPDDCTAAASVGFAKERH